MLLQLFHDARPLTKYVFDFLKSRRMCFGLSCNYVDSHKCFCVDEAFEQNSVERCLIACVCDLFSVDVIAPSSFRIIWKEITICVQHFTILQKNVRTEWMPFDSCIQILTHFHIFEPHETFFFFFLNFHNRCCWTLFVAVPKWWSQSSGIGQQAAQFARSQ